MFLPTNQLVAALWIATRPQTQLMASVHRHLFVVGALSSAPFAFASPRGDRSSSHAGRHRKGSLPAMRRCLLPLQSTSSISEVRAPPSHVFDADGVQFSLGKARLMARFSSVAYEDPPISSRRERWDAELERSTDGYGVVITRPISKRERINDREGAEDAWEMAHVDATSPRPLSIMLSDCNNSGTLDDDESASYQFEWLALATNEKTSTQFDTWRITSADRKKRHSSDGGNDDILVVAFRGTRLSSYLELYTDIQLKQDMISSVEFGVCADAGARDRPPMSDNTREESAGDCSKISGEVMAHSGFLKAYLSIRPTLLQLLSENSGAYGHIWFTGHSLGAALATMAVLDVGSLLNDASNLLAHKSTDHLSPSSTAKLRPNLPNARISSYLFGTPRVGNQEFADLLTRLQRGPRRTVVEYYRINTPGDAVPFLPRGKMANRLGIDYVHAGASVFLPALPTADVRVADEKGMQSNSSNYELHADMNASTADQAVIRESYSQWMMRLEEDIIEQINSRIFRSNHGSGSAESADAGSAAYFGTEDLLRRIRIYPQGDRPPDPLSEIDPDYSGFFPVDPRTWTSSKSFRNFLKGEAVRSFRILRGGFVKNHKLRTYEDKLCLASQNNVFSVNSM